jgi:hypothetical protein
MKRFSLPIIMLTMALPAWGQTSGMRLSLAAGVPVQTGDAISGTLYYGALNAPFLSLSLAGLAAGSINDAFEAPGPVMCSAPTPLGAGGYQLLTGGTPIGGMTAAGGLAAAFDGVTAKGYAASAQSSSVSTGYTLPNAVGESFASSAVVTQIMVWAPTDDGFQGSLASGGWVLLASNTNNITTGIPIANGKYPGGNAATISYQFQNTTGYMDFWFVIYGSGSTNSHVAQVQLFKSTPNPGRGIIATATGDQSDHDIPACNTGTGTVDCPPGGCAFLGMFKIDAGTPGQVSCTLLYGLDRGCGIWNDANQEPICLHAGDPGPPVPNSGAGCAVGAPCYGYSPVAYGATQPPYQFGATEGNSLIRLRVLSGLPTQSVRATYRQGYFLNATAAPSGVWFGIGINSTTQPTGHWPSPNVDNSGAGAPDIGSFPSAEAVVLPFVGEMTFNAIEGSRTGVTGFFGEGNQQLEACYKY